MSHVQKALIAYFTHTSNAPATPLRLADELNVPIGDVKRALANRSFFECDTQGQVYRLLPPEDDPNEKMSTVD